MECGSRSTCRLEANNHDKFTLHLPSSELSAHVTFKTAHRGSVQRNSGSSADDFSEIESSERTVEAQEICGEWDPHMMDDLGLMVIPCHPPLEALREGLGECRSCSQRVVQRSQECGGGGAPPAARLARLVEFLRCGGGAEF